MVDYKSKIDEARKLFNSIEIMPMKDVFLSFNRVQEHIIREMADIRRNHYLQLRTGAEY